MQRAVNKHPRRVALVALGPTAAGYVELVQKAGSRKRVFDEVWIVNCFTGLFEADLIFHMDDFAIQEARARGGNARIGAMLQEMRRTTTPIMTSRKYDSYPTAIEYPLQAVLNSCGSGYFNCTVPYAVAYALHTDVTELSLFGLDFFWPSNPQKMERGKACTEFWLGKCMERGMAVRVLEYSTLMDGGRPTFYGYDTRKPNLKVNDRGIVSVEYEEVTPPSAEEIERRYDHSKMVMEAK